MKTALIIATLQYVLMAFISAFLAYQFYISKNGMLRRLLILFFISYFFTILCSALYYITAEHFKYEPFNIEWVRVVALTPITIVMILLYLYIHKQNKENDL